VTIKRQATAALFAPLPAAVGGTVSGVSGAWRRVGGFEVHGVSGRSPDCDRVAGNNGGSDQRASAGCPPYLAPVFVREFLRGITKCSIEARCKPAMRLLESLLCAFVFACLVPSVACLEPV